jgi:hypothetical protein
LCRCGIRHGARSNIERLNSSFWSCGFWRHARKYYSAHDEEIVDAKAISSAAGYLIGEIRARRTNRVDDLRTIIAPLKFSDVGRVVR